MNLKETAKVVGQGEGKTGKVTHRRKDSDGEGIQRGETGEKLIALYFSSLIFRLHSYVSITQ